VDPGQSTDFRTHVILYERNILGFENLANLEQLPPTGARIYALPMKIRGGSGAPCRIIAEVRGADKVSGKQAR
jgi:kynurenine formamidase